MKNRNIAVTALIFCAFVLAGCASGQQAIDRAFVTTDALNVSPLLYRPYKCHHIANELSEADDQFLSSFHKSSNYTASIVTGVLAGLGYFACLAEADDTYSNIDRRDCTPIPVFWLAIGTGIDALTARDDIVNMARQKGKILALEQVALDKECTYLADKIRADRARRGGSTRRGGPTGCKEYAKAPRFCKSYPNDPACPSIDKPTTIVGVDCE